MADEEQSHDAVAAAEHGTGRETPMVDRAG
jgi:hypothetical protein